MKLREIRQHNTLATITVLSLLVIDIVAFYLAYNVFGWFNFKYPFRIGAFVVIFLYLFKRYNPAPQISITDELKIILKLIITLLAIRFLLILIFGGINLHVARMEFLFSIILFFFLSFGRVLVRLTQKKLLKFGIGLRNVILIGSGEKSIELIHLINSHPHYGYKLIGYGNEKNSVKMDNILPYIGSIKHCKQFMNQNKIHDIIISLDHHNHHKILEILGQLENPSSCIKIVPDMYEAITGQFKMNKVSNLPLVDIKPEILTEYQRIIKKSIDIIISVLGLIIMMPVCLFIGILIKIESKGPVIYSQVRIGQYRNKFKLLKFRTMLNDSEIETGPVWAKKNDPRITKVGRILRKIRLDEIPQLVNVIRGEMSLVGPRPERPYFVDKLCEEYPYYVRRLSVKPGITGWAQVVGSYDSTIENVKNKLKLDFFYIENISLILDIKILLLTIWSIFKLEGH